MLKRKCVACEITLESFVKHVDASKTAHDIEQVRRLRRLHFNMLQAVTMQADGLLIALGEVDDVSPQPEP